MRDIYGPQKQEDKGRKEVELWGVVGMPLSPVPKMLLAGRPSYGFNFKFSMSYLCICVEFWNWN